MGRRALRKISPTLDYSQHLKVFEQLPHPWETSALFGRTGELEIEVGTGKGLFLSAAAATTPERNFLGIEIAMKYAHFAAARLAKRTLENALVIHGDARRIFNERLTDGAAAAVHVYFPDPWWKARHRRRRIMSHDFLLQVLRVLKPGGTLHFWTDVQEYYESSLDVLREIPQFEGPLPVAERPADHDLDYRTHFERRMRLHQLPVYRSEFRK